MSYSSIPVYWSSLSLSLAHPFSYGLCICLSSHPYSLSTLSLPFPLLLSIWLAPSVLPLNRMSISIILALCMCLSSSVPLCVSLSPIGLCLVRCLCLARYLSLFRSVSASFTLYSVSTSARLGQNLQSISSSIITFMPPEFVLMSLYKNTLILEPGLSVKMPRPAVGCNCGSQ